MRDEPPGDVNLQALLARFVMISASTASRRQPVHRRLVPELFQDQSMILHTSIPCDLNFEIKHPGLGIVVEEDKGEKLQVTSRVSMNGGREHIRVKDGPCRCMGQDPSQVQVAAHLSRDVVGRINHA